MGFVVPNARGIPFDRAAGPGGYDTTLGRPFPSGPDGHRPVPCKARGLDLASRRVAGRRAADAVRIGRETGLKEPFCAEPGPKPRRGLMP
jgi:hypothetical protein